MAGILEIACGIAVIIFLLYRYMTSSFDFWKIRGVKGPKPIIFFGNIKDVMLRKKSMTEFMIEAHNEYKEEPFIGVFFRTRPVLFLTDPKFIKDILIRDFSSFTQRSMAVTEKAEPLIQHLVLLETKRWRPLRSMLTPNFSSGKLKEMFHLMLKCTDDLQDYLNKIPENDIAEFRELAARFTTDVIGSCAFGIETNALSDENSKFREIGRQIFEPSLRKAVAYHTKESFPRLYDNLGFLFGDDGYTKFFMNAFAQMMDYRKKNKIIRHDCLNTLMELKENPDKLGKEIELTDSLLAAQAFVIFAAGFETSSSTISNALYELAQHQDVQDRLRKEIREEYKKNGGTIKFESIKSMPYLHAVFQETLRKYPAGLLLFRECVAPSYTFEGTNVTIPKKQAIVIPLIALHRDSDIFPNPDLFDPERFTNEKQFDETRYMPFGRGPRNCIGERFAVYQSKVGIIAFLRNHKVEVCEKTDIPYTIDPGAFLLAPKWGIHLKISKVSENTEN